MSSFCAYCGNEIGPRDSARSTCRPSCIRKLRGLCKEVALKLVKQHERDLRSGDDPGEAFGLRDAKDLLWHRLGVAPVPDIENCVVRLGNRRVVVALSYLYQKQLPPGQFLDLDMYVRLLANGWIDRSDYVECNLVSQERRSASFSSSALPGPPPPPF